LFLKFFRVIAEMVDSLPETFRVSGPAIEVPLVLRLNPEMQPVAPVQDVILGFHRVIPVPF
jgi:hypothetical protein